MEPWRAADAYSGGLESKKWSPGGSIDQWPHTDPDPDPEKSLIRICIIVMRIRNLQYPLWLREFLRCKRWPGFEN
jgi:hypothetical protein